MENVKSLAELIENNKIVIVDFYAPWCGPCRNLSPLLDKLELNNPDVKFVKVNIDEVQNLALQYNVDKLPTILLIKNKEVFDRKVGIQTEVVYQSAIDIAKK